jgi:hypothetical protein
MTADDFTEMFVQKKLLNYLVNENFPADELSEIGSKVYIQDLSDVEISSVTKDGDNFVVDGTAGLETVTDMGEGDKLEDSYPLTFSIEFDGDGKIVRQHKSLIDTSSFFK